ncbi:MAG: rhodanese-like domain-containing protein [Flavobacteriaceae bacterium]|nr:rhodanese-like domain-containing protein [Flavobacteriaceae bacterium]
MSTLACKQEIKKVGVTLITPEEMQALLLVDQVQLIDVRTPEEFESGYVKNAVNMNFYDDDFSENLDKLDKTKPVCVYCKKGGRSAKAAKQLHEKGFEEVYDLDGGITNWIKKYKTVH